MTPGEIPNNAIAPVGYTLGPIKEFVIPSGEDGTGTEPVVFDRHHTFFVIWCEDASGISPTTTMGVNVAYHRSMDPVELHNHNEPGTAWANSDTLPTSGGFAFQLTEAIGAMKLQIVLDTATADDVTFSIMGVDQAVG